MSKADVDPAGTKDAVGVIVNGHNISLPGEMWNRISR